MTDTQGNIDDATKAARDAAEQGARRERSRGRGIVRSHRRADRRRPLGERKRRSQE